LRCIRIQEATITSLRRTAPQRRSFSYGCGFVAIHWATDCAIDPGQDYLKLLGGWWSSKFGGLDIRDTRAVQTGRGASDQPRLARLSRRMMRFTCAPF